IPEHGASSYRTNYILKSMAEALEKNKKPLEKSDINCDICELGEQYSCAVAKCIECDQYLCKVCEKCHSRMKDTKSHQCIQLTGGAEEDPDIVEESLIQKKNVCSKHFSQPRKFYCKTHKIPLCKDCLSEHLQCPCIMIKDVAQAEMKNVFKLKGLINQRKDLIDKHLKTSNNLIKTQQQKLSELLNAITSNQRDMQSVFDKHFNSLKSEAKALFDINVKRIQSRLSDIELQQGVNDCTFHHLNLLQEDHVELISLSADIQQRLQDWSTMPSVLASKHFDKSLQTHAYKPGYLDVSELGHISSSKSIHGSAHLVDKTCDRSAIQDLCVGENQHILVVESPTKEQCTIVTYAKNSNKLIKKSTKRLLSCGACSTKDKCYAVCDLANDCIAIYSYDLVHQKNIGRFERLTHVCMNSAGDLMVMDKGGKCVYIVDYSDGSILATISIDISCHSSNSLTTTNRYAVIASDWWNNCVKMFNRKGELVLSYGTKGSGDNQLNCPSGVCTDSLDNIIIADSRNHRIHMLDPTGKFIKYLLTPENNVKYPYAVAIDHNGDLLVGTENGDLHFIKYRENQK
ncbi:unnamed protein product, partial [Owenia fusiformis]